MTYYVVMKVEAAIERGDEEYVGAASYPSDAALSLSRALALSRSLRAPAPCEENSEENGEENGEEHGEASSKRMARRRRSLNNPTTPLAPRDMCL